MASLRTLVILAIALVACGAPDVGSFLRDPAPVVSAQTNAQDAVKQVIERANQAQAAAFNGGDATAMKATATDAFYTDLIRTNRELAGAGGEGAWMGAVGLESRGRVRDGTQAAVGGADGADRRRIERLARSSRGGPLSEAGGETETVATTQVAASDWSSAMKNNTTGER